MNDQSTVFDQCQTRDTIHTQLQHLAQELLATIHKDADTPGEACPERSRKERRESPGMPGNVNLSMLSELSYSDLKQYRRPVFLLSEINRLLFKSGDRKSLQQSLLLSHIIYQFICKHNESAYISYLYKGIAQIGLHMTDLGIKNVSIGMTGSTVFPMLPVDRVLGYWAIMSAAITNKNLRLAVTFAKKWQHAAQETNLGGEILRAKIVILLINLLFGEGETCMQRIAELILTSPEEWTPTVNFLAAWAHGMTGAKSIGDKTFSEPYPLFLGFDWHSFGEQPGEFSNLCNVRQRCCCKEIARMLPAQEIEQYADIMAQWELPGPLREFEIILKEQGYNVYVQSKLTRLLGNEVVDKMLNETPVDPNIIRRDEAIIWVMDVRKFSALSEKCIPEEVFELLNPVFKIISEELEQIGGTILEFIGDGLVVVFNTFHDQYSEMPSILYHTIRSLQRIYVLNAMSHQTELPDIRIGVGINKGPAALGYLGCLKRCHLTVLGNTINIAARLETASKELPGDVIVSAACFDYVMPDIWKEPFRVNYSLRDLGQKHKHKNISNPVQLFGISPLLRYWVDFVPMGFVAHAEKGVVYLDTGNSNEPGIIDHHFEGHQANSACELLMQNPTLLLGHVRGLSPSQIEFRMHILPDLDCAATLYATQELMEKKPRKTLLRKLAAYVSNLDQGKVPEPEWISDSLYGIFKAHQLLSNRHEGAKPTNAFLLEAGLRVIDAAMYLMEAHQKDGDFASIFHFQPEWFAEEKQFLREDITRYQEDVQMRTHTYTARVNGIIEPVTGLWLDHPQSIFFRIWGWNDPKAPGGKGYPFLALDFSLPGKNRFVIGVAPGTGTNLNGLGQLMEVHEKEKRKQSGKERPIHPIRHPSDNSDPWYFGQGHNYAVIDSPGQGTVLTVEEVQKIHAGW